MNRPWFRLLTCWSIATASALIHAETIKHPAPIAAPLPIGTQEMAFLFDNGKQLILERRQWGNGKIQSFQIPAPPRDKDGYLPRHLLAENSSGIWLVGPSVTLLRPDGMLAKIDVPVVNTDKPTNPYEGSAPDVAVGLQDGTLLLVRKVRGEPQGRVLRLHWAGGDKLVSQAIEGNPRLNHGVSATRLSDGRVMFVGGDSSMNKAWIFNPKGNTWETTGQMRTGRMYAGLAATPDGGAFVAGSGWSAASSDFNEQRFGTAHGAEIWNPRTGAWTELPPLPLSFRVTAYRAEGPSASVLPDGSLVMAGGMHTRALLLRNRNGRYASQWSVLGTLPEQRVGGVIQGIGGQEVIISGGALRTINGQCCRLAEGSERVRWESDGERRAQSVGQNRTDAAIAQSAESTFIAGGWESFHLSFGAVQASALAELIDRRNGISQALPSLPYPLFAGRAAWLNQQRIVVKAIAHRALYEQPFRGMDGRSLEFDSRGYLATLDLNRNHWRILEDERIATADLAGILNGEAVLIDATGPVLIANLDTMTLRELPPTIYARQRGQHRILSNGRIIVAGGEAQSQAVEAIDAECRQLKCPQRLFGTGPLTPARRYEILRDGNWDASLPSRGEQSSTVIRGNGQVVTLGWQASATSVKKDSLPDGRWLVEASSGTGNKWQLLPWPAEFNNKDIGEERSCGQRNGLQTCRLLIAEHPAAPQGLILMVHSPSRSPLQDIWRWDDNKNEWQVVSREFRQSDGLFVSPDRIPLVKIKEKTLFGADLLSKTPRYWME